MARKTKYQKIRQNGLVYVGKNGAHLGGIPMQNLSPDYVAHLSVKEVDLCLNSGLYEIGAESPQESDS